MGTLGVAKADVSPIVVDTNITFESIGGLDHHIQSLKEMVAFPLLYPEVFQTLDVTPPKGVLFHGPPGTGKTLVARALANSCSGSRPVAFFMRKGADILSKWVGEAERQLRLLFDEARRLQPSIIFFDEIDGLAPVRSSKNDQIHSSIVSTLLALMDGLDNRGQVIVIGATNRIDAIDPALRRPGRFDREFLFALPGHEARSTIINILTSKWETPLSDSVKALIADRTGGYCGADLKQLCTEAALSALRRQFPQIYLSNDRLLFDPKAVQVQRSDFEAALRRITPASGRGPATTVAKALPADIQPLLQKQLVSASQRLEELFPPMPRRLGTNAVDEFGAPIPRDDIMLRALSSDLEPKPLAHRPRLLIAGASRGSGQAEILAALLERLEAFPQVSIDIALLHADSVTRSLEESLVARFNEAARRLPSVLIIPHVDEWWEQASASLRATLSHLASSISATAPLLILATADQPQEDIDKGIISIFSPQASNMASIVTLNLPDTKDRTAFFHPLVHSILIPPASLSGSSSFQTAADLPVLERAPPIVIVRKENPQDLQSRAAFDNHMKRQMRTEFRDIIERLRASRSKFAIFWKTLNDANYPEYSAICPNALNLQDILKRVDAGCYITPTQFLVDFDSIVRNAELYFADDDPNGVIPRAKAMKDMVDDMIYDIGDQLIELAVDTATRCEATPKPPPTGRSGPDDDASQKEGEEFRRLSKRVAKRELQDDEKAAEPVVEAAGTADRAHPVTPPKKQEKRKSKAKFDEDAMDVDGNVRAVRSASAAVSSSAAGELAVPSTPVAISTRSSSSTSPSSAMVRMANAVRESQQFDISLKELNALQSKLVSVTEKFDVDHLMLIYVKVHNMILEENKSVAKKRVVERIGKWAETIR